MNAEAVVIAIQPEQHVGVEQDQRRASQGSSRTGGGGGATIAASQPRLCPARERGGKGEKLDGAAAPLGREAGRGVKRGCAPFFSRKLTLSFSLFSLVDKSTAANTCDKAIESTEGYFFVIISIFNY
jgi:hypothetical protein